MVSPKLKRCEAMTLEGKRCKHMIIADGRRKYCGHHTAKKSPKKKSGRLPPSGRPQSKKLNPDAADIRIKKY